MRIEQITKFKTPQGKYELLITAHGEISFNIIESTFFNPHFWHDDPLIASISDLQSPQPAWNTLVIVRQIIFDWIERTRPAYFAFSATNTRRQRIYQYLIAKHLHRLSCTYEVFGEGLHFTFVRIGDRNDGFANGNYW